jgi:hypothetical protein
MNHALALAAICAVLLVSSHSPADVPSPSTEAVHVLDLALLSHNAAAVAEGHRGLFRIDLDSQPGDVGSHVVYDCASPYDVNRTVWLWPGQPVADTMTVEGTLRLVWHPRSKDGQFAGFWEYRLMDAVKVK